MSKLLERLRDTERSGVYRSSTDRAVREAVAGSSALVLRVPLGGASTKAAVLERIAEALRFPEAFGRNWDALEDFLRDLSWLEGSPRVLLLEGGETAPERPVLLDILQNSAEHWKGRGVPFFAVFLDPKRVMQLPDLHKE